MGALPAALPAGEGSWDHTDRSVLLCAFPSCSFLGCAQHQVQRMPSAFGFTSSQAPLLTVLHERLSEYETAVEHAFSVAAKYGEYGAGYELDPTGQQMHARMEQTAVAFDAVLQHVDAVSNLVGQDYVLIQRDRCSPGNAAFRVPSEDADEDRQRTLFTKSPILAHSRTLELSFRPHPSCEVLARSPILSNSPELRLLAAGL